ncbi:MAG: GumC family protein [Opitutales bacterium]
MTATYESDPSYEPSGATRYAKSLLRYGVIAVIVGVLGAAAFGYWYLNQPKLFAAHAKLQFDFKPSEVAGFDEVLDQSIERGLVDSVMNTHRERITSRNFATDVVENLSEAETSALASALEKPAGQEPNPERLSHYLVDEVVEVNWLPDTQILEIIARHNEPALAEAVANGYATAYRDLMIERTGAANEAAVSSLKAQAERLGEQLREDRQALQDYRQEHDLVSIESDRANAQRRFERLDEALTEVQLERVEIASILEDVRQAESNDELLAIPELANYGNLPETQESLDEARTRESVLLQNYLPRHPEVVDVRAEIQSLESTLERNLSVAVSNFQRQLNALQNREQELKQDLAEAESDLQELNQLAIGYDELEQNLASRQETYQHVSRRLNETRVTSDLQQTTVSVLEQASKPEEAVSPVPMIAAAGSGLILVLALVLVPTGMELTNRRLQTFSEVEAFLQKPVLGHIRHRRTYKTGELTRQREDIELVEAFRGIIGQAGLALQGPVDGVFLVTSTAPGEGKSFVAANFAAALTEHGKRTLLIDGDLRRPRVHHALGEANDRGLLTWAEESGDPDSTVGLDFVEGHAGLQVLRSGGVTKRPTEFLQDRNFQRLLHNLRAGFDAIVIDSPPVGPCPDPLMLASAADYTIFVARQNRVLRGKARAAVRRVDQAGAPVTGVVLNGVRGRSAEASYGGYESDYGVSSGYGSSYYASGPEARVVPRPSESAHRRSANSRKREQPDPSGLAGAKAESQKPRPRAPASAR